MKKKLSLLATIFILTSLFIACEKNATEISNSENTVTHNSKTSNPYNVAGIQHNQGLDFVFMELANINFSGLTKQDIIKVVKNSCKNYCNSLRMSKADIITTSAIIDAMVQNDMFEDNNFATLIRNSKNITNEQASYLIAIASLMEERMTNEAITLAIGKIENQVSASIKSNNERNEVLFVAAIAKSSYCYWNSNADKWAKMLDSKIKASASIGGSDACGAAVGAGIGTCIIPGAGTGGGAIGGAVGASTVAAVYRFLDWWN